MAAKINTKFVFLLLTICTGLAIVVGALAFLALKDDPTRNLRRGETLMAEGDYRGAMLEYGRASRKEPSDLNYLGLFEDALLRIRPETDTEAQELYNHRVNVLRLRAEIRSSDVDFQRALLQELYDYAIVAGVIDAWETLSRAAATAVERVSPGTEGWADLKAYELAANVQLADVLSSDENRDLEQELAQFLMEHPQSGLVRHAYGQMLLQRARQARLAQKTADARDLFDRVKTQVERGLEHSPDHPLIHALRIRYLANLREMNSEDFEESQIQETAERLYETARDKDDQFVLREAVGILRQLGATQRERAIELLNAYVERHPEAVSIRAIVAREHFAADNHKRAEELARQILDAEQLTVSLEARQQFHVRKNMAKLLFDAEFVKLDGLEGEAFEAQLERARTARDHLAEMVANPDQDLRVVEADAWLASIAGDYSTAAERFTRVIEGDTYSLRTLLGAMRAFEQQNAPGEALRCVTLALEMSPRHPVFLRHAARLALRIGRAEEAIAYATEILDAHESASEESDTTVVQAYEPYLDDAREIRDRALALEERELGGTGEFAQVIDAARQAVNNDDPERGRAILIDALSANPQNIQLFQALVQIEVENGWREEAIERIRAKIEQFPGDQTLRRLLAIAEHEDPVDVIKSLVEQRYDDEGSRAVAIFVGLRSLAESEATRAARLARQGQSDEAAEAEAEATRIETEAERYHEQVKRLAPNDPTYLEYRFENAIDRNDFDAAKEIAARAAESNADRAEGLTYQARLELAQGNVDVAVRTLSEATKRLPFNPTLWRALGATYRQLGRIADAIGAFQNAIDRQPNDPITVRAFAELLMESGSYERALELLRDATAKGVGGRAIREMWLQAEAEAGDAFAAITERRRLYEQDPDDVANAVQLALLLANKEPDRRSVLDPRKRSADNTAVEKYTENEWMRLGQSERREELLKIKQAWIAEGEKIIAGIGQANETIETAYAKAQFYRDTGRVDEGFDVLQSFIERQDPENLTSSMFAAAAQYLRSVGDVRSSIEWLQRGRQYQNPDAREIDLELAKVFYTINQHELAHEHYLRVAEVNSDSSIRLQIAETEIKLGQYDDAEARLDQLEEEGEGGHMVQLMRSWIYRGRGDNLRARGEHDQAEQMYRRERNAINLAIELAPAHHQPYLVKAQSLFEEFRRSSPRRYSLLDQVKIELTNALSRNAEFIPALRLQASVLLAQSPPDYRSAIGVLRRVLDANPRDAATRRQVMELCARADDFRLAAELAASGTAMNPSDPQWMVELGEVLERAGRLTDAAAAYARALEIDDSPSTKEHWVRAKLLTGEQSDAADVVRRLSQTPEEVKAIPGLQCLYARALESTGNWSQAVEQLRLAYQQYDDVAEARDAPNMIKPWFDHAVAVYRRRPIDELDALVMELSGGEPDRVELFYLGRAWLARGPQGSSRAIELFQQAYDDTEPGDINDRALIMTFIGKTHWQMRNFDAAREAYERAVEQNPDFHEALNDLAYTLVTGFDEPRTALEHAKRAVELRPDNAGYHDTLGAVYMALEEYDSAQASLERSLELSPSAPTHVRLAEVLIELDDGARAREHLDRAAQMNPDRETQAEIDRLRDDIRL